MAEKIRAKEDPELGVLPENHEAVAVFQDSSTQWRTSMAGLVGLDYCAVKFVMECNQVEDLADCLWRVRVMEHAWLKGLNSGG